MDIAARIISCPDRAAILSRTLELWRATDWGCDPAVEMDSGDHPDVVARIAEAWQRALDHAAGAAADYWLFLEDDVVPNRFLRHNLERWLPLRSSRPDGPLFASLYWCQHPVLYRDEGERYAVAVPNGVWGSQALLVSRGMVAHLVQHWDEVPARHHDVRMPRLAAQVCPLYFHLPSLVQHRDVASTWGNDRHGSDDFDINWRAPERPPTHLVL